MSAPRDANSGDNVSVRCVHWTAELSRRTQEALLIVFGLTCTNSNRNRHEYAPTISDPCSTRPSWRSGGVSRTESTGHARLGNASWNSARSGSPGGRSTNFRNRDRCRTRSVHDDIRRSGKARAGADDELRTDNGGGDLAFDDGTAPRASGWSAESRARGGSGSGNAMEPAIAGRSHPSGERSLCPQRHRSRAAPNERCRHRVCASHSALPLDRSAQAHVRTIDAHLHRPAQALRSGASMRDHTHARRRTRAG